MPLPKIGKLIREGKVKPPTPLTSLMHILRRTLSSNESSLSDDELASLIDSHDLEASSETSSRDEEGKPRKGKSRRPEG